jgi:hypothetical protein
MLTAVHQSRLTQRKRIATAHIKFNSGIHSGFVKSTTADVEYKNKYQFSIVYISLEPSGPEHVKEAMKANWGCAECQTPSIME